MSTSTNTHPTPPPKKKRLYSFDLARSFAVFLMVVGHCINAYNDGAHMESLTLHLLQRAAPALFIIIFGLFLQMVYAKSMQRDGFGPAAKRLFSRAIQCYALYVLSCIILAISDNYSVAYTLRMSVLLGATPYTDILKYYAFTLLMAPFLLYIKQRVGYVPIIVFCVITHSLHFAFYPEPVLGDFPGSVILAAMLYGASDIIAGPSLVHGIAFVATGMWLAEFIKKDPDRSYILDLKNPSVLSVFIMFSIWLAWIAFGYDGNFAYDLTTMKFRNQNSYIYYVFGISSAILLIDLFMRFVAWVGDEKVKPYLFFGTTSLFIFCFGNCLLYVTKTEGLTNTQATIATLASIIASTAMSWYFDAFKKKEPKLNQDSAAMKTYKFIAKGYADTIAQAMVYALTRKKA